MIYKTFFRLKKKTKRPYPTPDQQRHQELGGLQQQPRHRAETDFTEAKGELCSTSADPNVSLSTATGAKAGPSLQGLHPLYISIVF